MSRIHRLREIARTSLFKGERDNARRLADRLSGQRTDKAKAAAAALNALYDPSPDWRETPEGWESEPSPNAWGVPALAIKLSDEQIVAQADLECGPGWEVP